MAGKKRRPVHLHVMVSEEEQELIRERMAQAGMYDLGYDPEVLGRNRLSGIQNVVCKQAVSAKGFHERPQRRRGEGAAEGGDTTTQAQLRQVQHRLKYLEQEVEFLKKYPLPEVRESRGRGHEQGFHHLFPDPSDPIRQRKRIICIHDVPGRQFLESTVSCDK